MLALAVTYKAKLGKREAALQAARICSEKTRQEPGSLDYTFYEGIDDEQTFFLFEQWESQEALDRHIKSEHLAAFRTSLKDLLERPSSIRVFEVSSVRAKL